MRQRPPPAWRWWTGARSGDWGGRRNTARPPLTSSGTLRRRGSALSPEADVLMDFPILHDDHEVLVRRGEQTDVLQRITGHHEEIGIGTVFDDAELSGIGIARA